jgi:hypothetical protein
MLLTSCSSLYFHYTDTYKYPEWYYQQYNRSNKQYISTTNTDNVVVTFSSTSLNPFGWSRFSIDRIELIVNKDIDIKSLNIVELVLENEGKQIVVVRNKNIKKLNFMYKTARTFLSGRAHYNENSKEIMTMRLVYRINNGEFITQTNEVKVWK